MIRVMDRSPSSFIKTNPISYVYLTNMAFNFFGLGQTALRIIKLLVTTYSSKPELVKKSNQSSLPAPSTNADPVPRELASEEVSPPAAVSVSSPTHPPHSSAPTVEAPPVPAHWVLGRRLWDAKRHYKVDEKGESNVLFGAFFDSRVETDLSFDQIGEEHGVKAKIVVETTRYATRDLMKHKREFHGWAVLPVAKTQRQKFMQTPVPPPDENPRHCELSREPFRNPQAARALAFELLAYWKDAGQGVAKPNLPPPATSSTASPRT